MELSSLLQSSLAIGSEIVLIITATLLAVLAPLIKRNRNEWCFSIALAGTVVAMAIHVVRFDGVTGTAFAGALTLDLFSDYFSFLFLLGALLVVCLSRDYVPRTGLRPGEYYALILFATSATMLISSAAELMSLFVGFEVMSVCAYILTGLNRRSVTSSEAGLKYLVLGGLSSAILLYGISFLYGATGTVYLADIAAGFTPADPLYAAGAALVLVGFVFKLGAFPFHQWVPDVYEGAPVSVTAFMSVAVKAAAFAILIRVLYTAAPVLESHWTPLLWGVSLATMLIGNFAALAQRSVKRMLAYSSIAHAGYTLIGVVAAQYDKTLGLGSVLYYMFAYTVMNLGAFGVLVYLSREDGECETLDQLSGLWQRKPFAAVVLAVFMFSLIGVPPTLGFFAKYRVFLAGVDAGFHWLVVIGILSSIVSAYYYLRVLVYAFMRKPEWVYPKRGGTVPAAVLALLCVGTVSLGVFDPNGWRFAMDAVRVLLAGP